MIQNTVNNWLRRLTTGQPAKRAERRFSRWIDQAERLEERQVLSAVTGAEELPVPAEVASTTIETSSASPKHGRHAAQKAVTYPTLTGVWNLNASAVIDGDPPLNFSGTVQISQNNRKITGNVQLSGLPLFTIKGKLSNTNVFDLSGSTKFPVDFGNGDFHAIKGQLSIDFNQNLVNFTGTVQRTIFGHTINVSLTGSKQM